MRRCVQVISIICFFICGIILMFVTLGYARIPDEMTVSEFDSMNVGRAYVCETLTRASEEKTEHLHTQFTASVKLFNIFPVKETKVTVSRRKYVIPGGNIFGIRLYTRGVMVIRIDEVTTSSGNESPGRKAGLKEGDMILSANGVNVTRSKELSGIFSDSGGKTLKLIIKRNDKELTVSFTPAKADDGTYKGGLWVRDSTAGIGTVTWTDRGSGVFAGLGHAVCDIDTGEVMPLSGGDAVRARVRGCYKGKSGSAGELCGVFSSGTIGTLYINGNTGVYGIMNKIDANAQVIPVALRREVKTGAARIISTVDENGPLYYDIEITKVMNGPGDNQRNMIIKVTDKQLLEKTGGIVQGMSGSPIIQDGMLVGAVTHVFIDKPDEGYGIFAENMIETGNQLEKRMEKQAS